MKFSLFAHMEQLNTTKSYSDLYQEFISLCEIADQGGMHAIWTGEHHAMNFTIAPNPFVTIADLARRTKQVRLGTGTVVAPFWHPIKLAGEAAMTDIICDGRLELGVARGAYNFEYERLLPGLDAWGAGERLREVIPAVQKLWQGDYAHDGQHYQFPKTTSVPKPIQAGGPGIWVAARDPNSHEFAVSHHCNVQVTPLWQGDQEIESLMQKFNEACDKHTSIARPKIMLLQHTYVAQNEHDKLEAAQALSRYYAHFGAWFKNERPISEGVIEPLNDQEVAQIKMYSHSEMLNNLAIGSADEIIDRLKKYQQLGYDEYAFWIDCGMPIDKKRESLKRFIERVMPAFE